MGRINLGDWRRPGGKSRGVKCVPVSAPPPLNVKDLEGYFDNLAAAATNEKAVLGQLVANNTPLTETNAEMTEAVKHLQANVQMLRQEMKEFKQLWSVAVVATEVDAATGERKAAGLRNFAPIANVRCITCRMSASNWPKTQVSGLHLGVRACDGGDR